MLYTLEPEPVWCVEVGRVTKGTSMALKTPAVPAVMLAVMGVFNLVAALATFIPSFVHDRVALQFMPIWAVFLKMIFGGEPSEAGIKVLAVASQVAIGFSEVIIGLSLLGAAFTPTRRLALANFGLSFSTGMFGMFLLTMFALHDKSLPAWHQYPAILGWIGVTWVMVALDHQKPLSV